MYSVSADVHILQNFSQSFKESLTTVFPLCTDTFLKFQWHLFSLLLFGEQQTLWSFLQMVKICFYKKLHLKKKKKKVLTEDFFIQKEDPMGLGMQKLSPLQ